MTAIDLDEMEKLAKRCPDGPYRFDGVGHDFACPDGSLGHIEACESIAELFIKSRSAIPELIRMVRERDAEIAKMNRALLYIRDGVACVSPGCECGQSPRQIADAALKGGKDE